MSRFSIAEKTFGFKYALICGRKKHNSRYIKYLKYKIDMALSGYFTLITKIKNPRK